MMSGCSSKSVVEGVVERLKTHHGTIVDRDIHNHHVIRTVAAMATSGTTHFTAHELAALSSHFEYVTAMDNEAGLLALPRFCLLPSTSLLH